MFKNVSRIVSVIALLSIVLAACGTAATTRLPPRYQLRLPRQPVPRLPPRPLPRLPQPLPQALLRLLEPIGAPASRSSSSPAEHPVEASSRSSITVPSRLPRIPARMCNTSGPTGILPR